MTTRVAAEESTRLSADNSLDTRLDVHGLQDVSISLFDFREVDASGDVSNIAGNGGILASDTTPIMRANAGERQEISWAVNELDGIACQFSLPQDFNGAISVVLQLWVYSGATNPATFTVLSNWDEAAQVTDTATDGAASATPHLITATIDAVDIPDAANYVSIQLVPAAHATDAIQLVAARLNYQSEGGV